MQIQPTPDITIAVMSYNNEKYLSQTVESVLEQTGVSLELIVFDDCSSDGSIKILKRYTNDPRFSFQINDKNLGITGNYNRCVNSGSGRYIVVLGSDDLMYPGHLLSLFSAMELHPNVALAYTQCIWIDEQNKTIKKPDHPGHLAHSYIGNRNEVAGLLIHDNYITPSSVMLRRSALNRIRRADGNIHAPDLIAGDWDLWIRIAKKYPDFIFLHQATLGYRIHQGQISGEFYKSDRPLAEHAKILESNLADPLALPILRESAVQIWEHFQRRLSSYPATIQEKYSDTAQAIKESLFSIKNNTDAAPLFSIIVTTYNRPQLLVDALRSIDVQSYQDFEVILINDCGEPVEHLLSQFKASIQLVRHKVNSGLSAARNTGLKLAKGQYIVYLDDDDLLLQNHLHVLAEEITNSPNTVIYTDSDLVKESITHNKRIEQGRGNPHQHTDFSINQLMVQNFIPVNSFCHPRNIIESIGYFDEELPALEDWEFLLRLAEKLPFKHIQQTTVEVHMLSDSTNHHMSSRARKNFPKLFRKIYAAHPSSQENVLSGRKQMLQLLDAEYNSFYRPKAEGHQGDEETEGAQKESFDSGYELWRSKHSLEPIHAQIYAEHMIAWPQRPCFGLIIPTPQEKLNQLASTLNSMESQLYKEWQLIVVADYEAPSPFFLQSDTLGWLRIDDLTNDKQLVCAFNGLLGLGFDWIGILPPGSELAPHAFLALGDYAQAHPQWSAIYTDHDHKDEQGQYVQPWFKPDFNLDYLRSMDYVGAALWFKGEVLQRLGGFQPFPGAWLYDALLRLLDGEGEEAIGHIAEPLHHFPAQRQPHPLTQASRQVALENHLQRRGTAAQITAGLVPDTFHVQYQRPDTPLVSIIIPNRDFVWFLRPCLESLFAKTDYGNYEVVIVDNQTEDPDTLAYYQQLQATQGERVRIVPYDQPFNFSAQCNLGVAQARGEYVVLLNNDTEIVQGSWLTRMVSHLARPEVGIVGARLVFPEAGGIQHAGVILGMDQVASHAFMGLSLQDAGYMNRLQVEQNYSAVTGACLLIRKSTYKAVGGLNEENTPVLFNDIDLCLKVASVGQLIVWTPYATLIHHANVSINTSVEALKAKAASLERNALSAKFMHQRWKDFLRNDPAYNRHLALHTNKSFHVEEELVADWDANFQDRLKVLALPPAGGVGEYRFYAPLRALTDSAQLQSTIIQTKTYHKQRYLTLSEMERLGPDVLMAQVDYSPMFQDWLERYREMLPKLRINLMIDDLITEMPRDNPNFKRIPRDGRYRLRKLFKLADSVIVSTQPLLDLVSELTDKGVLVPNTLRDELWLPLQSRKRTGPKPRVGWAGAQQHKGDLAIIANVVKRTASQVDWVFFGMCPEEIRPYIAEFHDFVVGVEAYPAKLASLNLDLAVAPLEQHPFNQAKSNLRILEYGILGLPVICTDIYPYRTDDAPVTRVPNEEQAWVDAILERVNHPDQAEREGAALKQWVQRHYLLSQVQDLWFQAITGPRA